MKIHPGNDSDAYKALARHWAASVTVVTATRKPEHLDDGTPERDGFTATAFLTVSIDPPIILVSATNTSSAASLLKEASAFAVNLLAANQEGLSGSFAKPQSERAALWHNLDWAEHAGAPVLEGALGAFVATPRAFVDAGDHTLILGDVVAIAHGTGVGSLLYHNRAYGEFKPFG